MLIRARHPNKLAVVHDLFKSDVDEDRSLNSGVDKILITDQLSHYQILGFFYADNLSTWIQQAASGHAIDVGTLNFTGVALQSIFLAYP